MQSTFTYKMVSSIYSFQLVIYCDNVGSKFLSNSTMKILALTDHKGEPIAIPSFSKHSSSLKEKCTFFTQRISRPFNYFFVILASISLSVSRVSKSQYNVYSVI